jgi:phosphonate transport system substrate-binding protein
MPFSRNRLKALPGEAFKQYAQYVVSRSSPIAIYFFIRMVSRRLVLTQALWFLAGCGMSQSNQALKIEQLTIGTVSYGEGSQSVEKYQRFIDSLQQQTKILVQLEPAYNEVKAVEQIQRQVWSLVFAPPGLAAIAIAKAQYLPIFPLQGIDNLSAVMVVLKDSPITSLSDVNGQIIALGQPGSATGYYVPLYELYGTTPAEVRISPTPRDTLDWLATGKVAMGAMAKNEFDRYRTEFSGIEFRTVLTSRRIPSGSVLISPKIERNQQELLQNAMNDVLPAIAEEAGYVPNAPPPDYKTLIAFIEKVRPIEAHIHQKPAPLYSEGETPQ